MLGRVTGRQWPSASSVSRRGDVKHPSFFLLYPADLEPCAFCTLHGESIVLGSELAIAFLDACPVSPGHTLVIPRRHVASIYELTAAEQTAVWDLVGHVRGLLLAQIQVDGFNIGVNDGVAAGQTVMHAHVHLIPRHQGDVPDPRGGIRWVIASKAPYWK